MSMIKKEKTINYLDEQIEKKQKELLNLGNNKMPTIDTFVADNENDVQSSLIESSNMNAVNIELKKELSETRLELAKNMVKVNRLQKNIDSNNITIQNLHQFVRWKKRIIGLTNNGNTCFINSSL